MVANPIPAVSQKKPKEHLQMSSLRLLNPKAEYMRKQQAMAVQITAASGMQEVLKTNLGMAPLQRVDSF